MMASLVKLINKTLALDARTTYLFKKLNQKTIKIQIKEFSFLALVIGFNENGLHFIKEHETLAAEYLQVSGPAVSFAALLFTKDPLIATKLGLTMQGDIETAQNLQTLFLNLDIDWEELVAKYSNDSFAFYFGQLFKSFKKRQQVMKESLTQSMKEYLEEEAGIVASPNAFDNFMVELEELIEDCERLEARINLVSGKIDQIEETKQTEQAMKTGQRKQREQIVSIKQIEQTG